VDTPSSVETEVGEVEVDTLETGLRGSEFQVEGERSSGTISAC